MSHTPHELPSEFPSLVDQMHALKRENGHFARIFDAYHQVNREIHRAETNIEPVADVAMLDLRKERLRLKDEAYRMLNRLS